MCKEIILYNTQKINEKLQKKQKLWLHIYLPTPCNHLITDLTCILVNYEF